MEYSATLIVLIWLVVCVLLVVAYNMRPRKEPIDYKAIARDKIANDFPNFTISRKGLYLAKASDSKHLVHGLAVDHKAKEFCLIVEGVPKTFGYGDLIECQLRVDGQQQSVHSRLAKFTGTAIGDIVVEAYKRFGEPKEEVKTFLGIKLTWSWDWLIKPVPEKPEIDVVLRLIVNDIEKPFRTISLLESDDPDDDAKDKAKKEGELWFEVLKKVMVDADEKKIEPDARTKCIADELTKLMDLKHFGVITDEEYLTVKDRLVKLEA